MWSDQAQEVKLPAYQRYGIRPGQVYEPADGSKRRIIVRDVQTYAHLDDVIAVDEKLGTEILIDAYKLAKVRYCLVDTSTPDERQALRQALWTGHANFEEQQRAAELLQVLQDKVQAMEADARRGRHAVQFGEWRTSAGDGQDPQRTYLAVRVQDGADLSCKAFRALALDQAIASQDKSPD